MGRLGPLFPQTGRGSSLAQNLPPGWRVLAAATGRACHVLAHPVQGLMLLDLTPGGSPGIEASLGRTMAAAGLREAGAAPPVWYVRLEPAQLPRFADLMADALAAQPEPAATPATWMPRLEAALRRDAAWSGGPDGRIPAWLRRPHPWAAAVAAILLAALLWQASRQAPTLVAPPVAASGVPVWLEPGPIAAPADPPPEPAVAQPAVGTAASALPAPPREDPPAAAPPPGPASAAVVAPQTAPASAAVIAPQTAPASAAVVAPQPGPASATAIAPHPGPASATAVAPQPGPAATAVAPQPVASSAPRPRPASPLVDPRCAAAQLRFQRGEQLSAAELAYVRNGCVGRR